MSNSVGRGKIEMINRTGRGQAQHVMTAHSGDSTLMHNKMIKNMGE